MDADHEWEEAAFNTRHMHNRNDRGGQGNTRESFHIRQTFGTHLVKCPALERLQQTPPPGASSKAKAAVAAGGKSKQAAAGKKKAGRSNSGSGEVVLEIYRLTADENGILGALKLPGVFEAAVVFAGSRKILGNITRDLGQDAAAEEPSPYGKRRGSTASTSSRNASALKQQNGTIVNGSEADGDENEEDDDEDDDDEDDDEDEADDGEHSDESGLDPHERRRQRRVATFEKNSFRQPKFWFRWQGTISTDALANLEDVDLADSKVDGSGYMVFSGNQCRRFQSTMTSEKMGWNNVKMTGWKAKPQPERDFEIQWSRED